MTGVGAVFELYEHWTDKKEKKKSAKSKRHLEELLKEQEVSEDGSTISKQQKQQQKRRHEDSPGYRIEERLIAFQELKQSEKIKKQQAAVLAAGGSSKSTGQPPTIVPPDGAAPAEPDFSILDEEEYIDDAVYYHLCIHNNDMDGLWELLVNYDYQHYQEENKKLKEEQMKVKKKKKPKRRLRIVRGVINVKNYLLPDNDEEEDDPFEDPTRSLSPLLGCDVSGRTPLHLICSNREVSDRVVLRMIQSEKQAAKVMDDYGQLPLHVATKCGKSTKIIDKLMRSNIPGIAQEDDSGRTPLWYCIQRTILTAEYGIEHHEEIPTIKASAIVGGNQDDDDVSIDFVRAEPIGTIDEDEETVYTKHSSHFPSSNHGRDASMRDMSMRDFTSRSSRSYYHNEGDFVEKEDGTTSYSTVAHSEDVTTDGGGGFMSKSMPFLSFDGNSSFAVNLNSNSSHRRNNVDNAQQHTTTTSSNNASFALNANPKNAGLSMPQKSKDRRSQMMQQSTKSFRSTRTIPIAPVATETTESSSKLLTSKIHKIKFTSIDNDPYAKTTWGIPRTQEQIQWQERQEYHWSKVRFMLSAYSARRKIFKKTERELLLWVIDHAAPPSVIEVALFASQKLLKVDPTLASSALHLFMRRQYPIKNLHLLLHHFPVQNIETMDAARRLLSKYYIAGCTVMSSSDGADSDKPLSFRQEMEQKALNNRKPSLACAEWWDKCTALLKLCGHENVQEEKTKFDKAHLLHAALCNPETPPSLIQLLMVLNPKSIALSHPSKKDAKLVHLICKSWKYNLFPHYEIEQDEPPMDQVLRIVLASDASLTRQRFERRLPLHHAIATCKSWKFIESLATVDKMTLSQRDPVTMLYPFQLAATVNNSKNAALWAHAKYPTTWTTHMTHKERDMAVQVMRYQQELEQCTSIYTLLRVYPQAIMSGAMLSRPAQFRDTTGRGLVSAHFFRFCYQRLTPQVLNEEENVAKENGASDGGDEQKEEMKEEESDSTYKDGSARGGSRDGSDMDEDHTMDGRTAVTSIHATSTKSSTVLMKGELVVDEDVVEYVLIPQNYELLRLAIETKTIPDVMLPWWDRCKFWIWYCYPKELGEVSKSPNDSFLLHAALANEDTPPIIIQLILAIYPLSASLPTFGVHGTFEYPLHIAARTPTYVPQDFEEPFPASVLQMVLDAFPEAAHVVNQQGLPIQIASSMGKTWEEVQGLLQISNENPNVNTMAMGNMANFQQSFVPAPATTINVVRRKKKKNNRATKTAPRVDHAAVAASMNAARQPRGLAPIDPAMSQGWKDLRRTLASMNITAETIGRESVTIFEHTDTHGEAADEGDDDGDDGGLPYGQHHFQASAAGMERMLPNDDLLGPASTHSGSQDEIIFRSEGGSSETDSYGTDASSWKSTSLKDGIGPWHKPPSSNLSTYSSGGSDAESWQSPPKRTTRKSRSQRGHSLKTPRNKR